MVAHGGLDDLYGRASQSVHVVRGGTDAADATPDAVEVGRDSGARGIRSFGGAAHVRGGGGLAVAAAARLSGLLKKGGTLGPIATFASPPTRDK